MTTENLKLNCSDAVENTAIQNEINSTRMEIAVGVLGLIAGVGIETALFLAKITPETNLAFTIGLGIPVVSSIFLLDGLSRR